MGFHYKMNHSFCIETNESPVERQTSALQILQGLFRIRSHIHKINVSEIILKFQQLFHNFIERKRYILLASEHIDTLPHGCISLCDIIVKILTLPRDTTLTYSSFVFLNCILIKLVLMTLFYWLRTNSTLKTQ